MQDNGVAMCCHGEGALASGTGGVKMLGSNDEDVVCRKAELDLRCPPKTSVSRARSPSASPAPAQLA